MKTVWKFTIDPSQTVGDTFTLDIPVAAQILTVQIQHSEIVLWALVDPTIQTERRKFRVVGTGYNIKYGAPMNYIGTVQLYGGDIVLHIFEYQKPESQQ